MDLSGKGYRIRRFARTDESRRGRFSRDDRGTTYAEASTVPSFATGGAESEFDQRIALMLEREKFELATSSIGERSRHQYMSWWRRWVQFNACMGKEPCIIDAKPGCGSKLIDFYSVGT